MQIEAEWHKHGPLKDAAAALLGVSSCERKAVRRVRKFLKGKGAQWRRTDFHGPPDLVSMYDPRINNFKFCAKTQAKAAFISAVVNDGMSDQSCAKTGLPYTPPEKVLQLAANIMELNNPLEIGDFWSKINDYGVIEQPFDPELLYCDNKLFHVRLCRSRCRFAACLLACYLLAALLACCFACLLAALLAALLACWLLLAAAGCYCYCHCYCYCYCCYYYCYYYCCYWGYSSGTQPFHSQATSPKNARSIMEQLQFDIWKANLHDPKRKTRSSWWSGLDAEERRRMGQSAEHASAALFALSQLPLPSLQSDSPQTDPLHTDRATLGCLRLRSGHKRDVCRSYS